MTETNDPCVTLLFLSPSENLIRVPQNDEEQNHTFDSGWRACGRETKKAAVIVLEAIISGILSMAPVESMTFAATMLLLGQEEKLKQKSGRIIIVREFDEQTLRELVAESPSAHAELRILVFDDGTPVVKTLAEAFPLKKGKGQAS